MANIEYVSWHVTRHSSAKDGNATVRGHQHHGTRQRGNTEIRISCTVAKSRLVSHQMFMATQLASTITGKVFKSYRSRTSETLLRLPDFDSAITPTPHCHFFSSKVPKRNFDNIDENPDHGKVRDAEVRHVLPAPLSKGFPRVRREEEKRTATAYCTS